MDQVTQTVSTLIRSLKLSRIAGMHGMPKVCLICINNNACHTESVLNATGPFKKGPPRSPFKSLVLSHDETKTVLVEQVVFTLPEFHPLPHPIPPPSSPRPHSKQIRSPFRRAVMRGKYSQSDISLAAEDSLCELNSITQLHRKLLQYSVKDNMEQRHDQKRRFLTCVSPLMCF